MVGIFVQGLRDDSRYKRKLSGIDVPENTLLLATIVDGIQMLHASITGIQPEQSIVNVVLGKEPDTKSDDESNADECLTYDSVEEFRLARYGG